MLLNIMCVNATFYMLQMRYYAGIFDPNIFSFMAGQWRKGNLCFYVL